MVDEMQFSGVKLYRERQGVIMRKYINAFDYAGDIIKALDNGLLLTVKANDKVNTMTIGWGHIGIEWGKPIFVAYVRENRYTKGMLDEALEFTVNVPVGEYDKKILGFCGSKSARDVDKIKALNLTLVEGEKVDTPAIKELPLTLECKIVYRQKQELSDIPKDIKDRYYPANVDGLYYGANKDVHTVYYGEIVNSYVIEG